MTFRWISMLAFLAVFGGIAFHALLFPFGPSGRWTILEIVRIKIHAFTLLFLEQKLNWIGRFKKLLLLLALLAFVVLFLTGFGPLLCGGRLEGYLLMLHAAFAPVLIGCAALLAIGWAHGMTFDKKDSQLLRDICRLKRHDGGCPLTDSGIGQKCCFWLLVFLSLPVALSMILSMFPIIDTEGQEFLFHLHRWSALLFACTAIICFYILVRRQILFENKQQTN